MSSILPFVFAENKKPYAVVMQNEFTRQQDGLELIASENFASPAVIAASLSSVRGAVFQ